MSKDTTSFRLLVWSALIRLIAFDLVTGRSFPRLHRVVRNWKVRAVTAPLGTTERVCDAVNHACIWYPKHVLCLQRSFVTTSLLRCRGVPARLVLGAQKTPFAAHAWVEVDGRAVNEDRDVAAVYAVWEKC
jgi:Transglutaminase-like superfamily